MADKLCVGCWKYLIICLLVASFIGEAAIAAVPVIQNVTTSSNHFVSTDNISWFVNATDADIEDLFFKYKVYKNGMLHISQTITSYKEYKYAYQENSNFGPFNTDPPGPGDNLCGHQSNSTLMDDGDWLTYSTDTTDNLNYALCSFNWYFPETLLFNSSGLPKILYKNNIETLNLTITAGCYNEDAYDNLGHMRVSLGSSYDSGALDYALVQCHRDSYLYTTIYSNQLTGLENTYEIGVYWTVYNGTAQEGVLINFYNMSNVGNSVGDNITVEVQACDTWNCSVPVNHTVTIVEPQISNCSNSSWYEAITFYGKDESDDSIISDMRLNIDLSAFISSLNQTLYYSAAFDNESNYSICVFPQYDLLASAVMEYGDGQYTDKKYHIVNASISAGNSSEVYLYHLNDSIASEVVYYVYEKGTNQPIDGAYIKVQRYYPEESTYKTVEIERTDDTGYALGKMILSDVFYRYIVEKPSGTGRLRTDVNKVLSLTRNFPISLNDNVLEDWYATQRASVSTTCTKSTKTCRLEWSDSSNIVQSGTLEIYRDTGTSKVKIHSQTVSSPSASIIYMINESTTGNIYEAVGYVESSSGSIKPDIAMLIYAETLGSNTREKIEFVLPLAIGTAFLMTLLLDFGVTGIVIGSLTGLAIGSFTFIIPLKYMTIISLVILGGIIIFKTRGSS